MATQIIGGTASNILGVDISTAALVAATQNLIQFANNGAVGLVVNNGGANSLGVTPIITNNVQGQVPPLPPRIVPAGKTWLIGSYSPRDYNGGNVSTTVSTPGVPATTVPVTNATGQGVVVTITGGTMTAVLINALTVGAGAGVYYLPENGVISMTFSVAPTWAWAGAGSAPAGSMLVGLSQLTSVNVALISIPTTTP